MSTSRRNFLLTSAAATFFLPNQRANADAFNTADYAPFLENFDLNILHEPENFNGQIDQEIIFLIDVSSSMDVAEVQEAITGALSAIREHNFLTDQEDERCPGTLGLGFIKFQSTPTSLGYAVLSDNSDVEALEQKAANFSLNVGGNTGVGNGLIMVKAMQNYLADKYSNSPYQRAVIVIGDEPSNHGPTPAIPSEEISDTHGATIHAVAMNQASDYHGVATVSPTSNGRWVDDGQIIEARTAEEIRDAILHIINPHCFMSHNLEADQVTTIDHA